MASRSFLCSFQRASPSPRWALKRKHKAADGLDLQSPRHHEGPAGAPSPCRSAIRPRLLREPRFAVWLAPACLHMGNKAEHCAGLATSFPSQSSRCVRYRGFGLNVPFVASLRVLRWVCLLCGSPGLNKYIKATCAA